jgi:hypothetical protein
MMFLGVLLPSRTILAILYAASSTVNDDSTYTAQLLCNPVSKYPVLLVVAVVPESDRVPIVPSTYMKEFPSLLRVTEPPETLHEAYAADRVTGV